MTTAPGVQPGAPAGPDGAAQEPGQGAPEGNGLYDLESVPPELREQLLPHLKAVEGNVTKKFQEHADFRKQWEPYEQMGITDIEPEAMQSLLELQEVFADEDSLKDWWTQVGEYMGFDAGQEPDGEPGGEDGDLDMSSIEEVIASKLDERLAPLLEAQRSADEQQRIQEAEQQIDAALGTLKEQHGEFDEDTVLRLALAYDGEKDPLEAAFRDYQELIAQAEKGLLDRKLKQPEAPEGGGTAATATEPITDFETAKRMAKERMRQSTNA